MRKLSFWYEFASTYSYISAMRIETLAQQAGIEVDWCPFLLGPLFYEQGWDTSPFNIYPAKGKYMWRDVQRRCERFGIPFKPIEAGTEWPQSTVLAARIALIGLDEGWGRSFSKTVYQAEFVDHADISAPDCLGPLITACGASAEDVLLRAASPENKDRLRAQTAGAKALGLFGAPSFIVGDELFWGDDRLEEAIDHAVRPGGSI